MGVAIGNLLDDVKEQFILTNIYKNKSFGFDAYNILYQFLTTIIGIDGNPLKNNQGSVTSHLNGLFYRVLNLLSNDIKIYFVFDGESIDLKQKTLDERRTRKDFAKESFEQAVTQGNLEDMYKFSRRMITIDDEIIKESKQLLSFMGVGVIDAPTEAEAQISYMTKNNLLDYTVSQDFDCLLFGSPNLVRNLTISKKKKIPSKNIYANVPPEIIYLEKVYDKLNLSREKLINLAILIGTDFNEKIKGIGPKTALKLVREFNNFSEIEKYLKEKNKKVNFDYKEVYDVFENPIISKKVDLGLPKFNKTKIENMLVDKFDFSYDRVSNVLNKFLKEKEEQNKQKKITDWI